MKLHQVVGVAGQPSPRSRHLGALDVAVVLAVKDRRLLPERTLWGVTESKARGYWNSRSIWEEQLQIISHIPWERRGAFLAAATESRRLSEVRAMDLDDYRDGRLHVWRAIQGPRAKARLVERTRTRPRAGASCGMRFLAWIEWRFQQATPEARLRGEIALFWCPEARNRTKRCTPDPLERQWHQECDAAGVAFISFQQGTRHSMLTTRDAVVKALPRRRSDD